MYTLLAKLLGRESPLLALPLEALLMEVRTWGRRLSNFRTVPQTEVGPDICIK